MSIEERVEAMIRQSPGLTDRELTDRLFPKGTPQQLVNQACRKLENAKKIVRERRPQGLIGNYPGSSKPVSPHPQPRAAPSPLQALSEDEVKRAVSTWLEAGGWHVRVAWGREAGIDIEARKGNDRWIIEAKGSGTSPQMRNNYFLSVLGEILQRIESNDAIYSIALPDIAQYRRLWARLPALARSRTGVTLLLVDNSGTVATSD